MLLATKTRGRARKAAQPRSPGIAREIGIGRVFAVAVLLLVALALQSSLLVQFTVLGVVPQLVFVVVVSLAFLDGESVGVTTGFFGGLLIDLLLPQAVVGLGALVYTVAGYAVGRIRQLAPSDSVWAPVFTVAAASFFVEISYATLAIILGQPWISFALTVKAVGLIVLYNTLLTPFVFPLVRRINNRYRPEKIYRW